MAKIDRAPIPSSESSGMSIAHFTIGGMTCGACVSAVERVLTNCTGVASAQVTLMTERARIEFDPTIINEAALVAAVEDIGFEADHLSTETERPAVGSFEVNGMHCGACVTVVERCVSAIPGVLSVSVSLLAKRATVRFIPSGLGEAGVEALTAAIEDVGFEATHLETVREGACDGNVQDEGAPLESFLHIVTVNQPAVEAVLRALPGVLDVQWLTVATPPSAKRSCGEALRPNVKVRHEDLKTGIRAIVEALKAAGSEATATAAHCGQSLRDARKSDVRMYRHSFLFSAIFTVPCTLIAMVLPRVPFFRDALMTGVGSGVPVSAVLLWVLSTPVQFIIGAKFYRGAFQGMKHGNFGMDFLIALGTSAAYFYSSFAVLYSAATYTSSSDTGDSDMVHAGNHTTHGSGSHHDAELAHHGAHFFETSAMLITFVILGKWLECIAKARTSEALSKLAELSAQTAWLLEEKEAFGEEGEAAATLPREIPVELVQRGDLVQVFPGGKVPADGEVVRGTSTVDESMLTGESMPVTKNPKDSVFGATVNVDGTLVVRVRKIGQQTALSRITKLVEDAQMSKAPIQAFADQVSGVFAPIVVSIALVTFVVWISLTMSGSVPEEWYPKNTTDFVVSMMFSIAVLVIACPCALGLATPTAVMVGTTVGAELGILIKGGAALEIAHSVTDIIFDKTGTLTKGEPEVTDVIILRPAFGRLANAEESGLTAALPALETENLRALQELLFLAAAAERGSEHPLARAIQAEAVRRAVGAAEPDAVQEFQAIPGKGVSCKVLGHLIHIGTRALMQDLVLKLSTDADSVEQAMVTLESQGKTVVEVGVDGELCGLIAMRDAVKPEAADAVAALEAAGVQVWMLTGDNRTVAHTVALDLGIHRSRVLSELLPHEKSQQVAALQIDGRRVGMVGDGINDAPALARADLGIAVGAGTDVAIEAADIVLCSSRLTDVHTAIDLSRVVFGRIRLNFVWALGFNTLGIPIAAGVFFPLLKVMLPPEVAGLAMAMSSVTVVSSSLLLRRYRPPGIEAQGRRRLRGLEVLPRILGAQRSRVHERSVDAGCLMATGGPCTCDADKCACPNCPTHPQSMRRRRASSGAATGRSCCEGKAEERLSLKAGCAMQWDQECNCDPATCQCSGCREHGCKSRWTGATQGTGSAPAKGEIEILLGVPPGPQELR
mmetsp:Transcript_46822/g.102319  ORF Transcript_46822/g.102319 Transcript_46822/m.102319 type:complete len:1181 (-) Transcript_46822:118-3660(-)